MKESSSKLWQKKKANKIKSWIRDSLLTDFIAGNKFYWELTIFFGSANIST